MIGLPEDAAPRLDQLVIRRGRAPERGAASEVVISEGFANTRDLGPGQERHRAHQRPEGDAAHRRRRPVARLHLRDARRRLSRRPQLRRVLDRARAARRGVQHGGRVQPRHGAADAGRHGTRGDRRARPAARALRRHERARPRRAALEPHPEPGDQPVEGDRHADPVDLPRGGGVPAQRRAEPPGRHAARADRRAEGAGLRATARSPRITCCRSSCIVLPRHRDRHRRRLLVGRRGDARCTRNSSTFPVYRFFMPPWVVLDRRVGDARSPRSAARWARCARR